MIHTCTIPVSYTVKGVLEGRKAAREYPFVEYANFQIDEVSSRDAPVAVSWGIRSKSPETRVDYISHCEVRACDASLRNQSVFYRGRHWLRILGGHAPVSHWGWSGTLEPSAPVTWAEFLRDAPAGRFNRLFGFDRKPDTDFSAVASDPSSRFSDIRATSRERVLRALERLEFISVDGVIHMAGEQPVMALASADEGHMAFHFPYVTCRRPTLLDNPHVAETLYLPLDKAKETMSGVRELSVEVHAPASMSADIDVLVAADYLVSKTVAAARRAGKRDYPDLWPYFGITDADGKAEFLQSVLELWPTGKNHLASTPIAEALEILDQRAITFGFTDLLVPALPGNRS